MTSPSGSTSSTDCSFKKNVPVLLARVKKDMKIGPSSFSAVTGMKEGSSAYVAAACHSLSDFDSNGNSLWPLEVRWKAQVFSGGDSESAGSRYLKPSKTSDWNYCDVMGKAHMNGNMLWSTDADGPFTLENGRYDHYGGGGGLGLGDTVSWGGTCSHCIGGYYKRWNFEYSIYSAAGYSIDSSDSSDSSDLPPPKSDTRSRNSTSYSSDSGSGDYCDIAKDCSQTQIQEMAECIEDTGFSERSLQDEDMCASVKEMLQCYDPCVCRMSCFQDQIKELKTMCDIETCSLKDSQFRLSGGLDNRGSIFCALSLMWLVTMVLI